MIEDKYIPPEPPKAPQPEPEEEEVSPEIQEAYEEGNVIWEFFSLSINFYSNYHLIWPNIIKVTRV